MCNLREQFEDYPFRTTAVLWFGAAVLGLITYGLWEVDTPGTKILAIVTGFAALSALVTPVTGVH